MRLFGELFQNIKENTGVKNHRRGGLGEHDCGLNYVGISPKRKGRCSTATVGISLSDETKVIEPVGEPHNTT